MRKIYLLLFSVMFLYGCAPVEPEVVDLPEAPQEEVAPEKKFLTADDMKVVVDGVNANYRAIAEITFVLNELGKGETLKDEYAEIVARWQEQQSALKKQAEFIAQQNAEIQRQRTEIRELKKKLGEDETEETSDEEVTE